MVKAFDAWLPHSFYRSPMWRTLRAEYRHEHGSAANRQIDDTWVERALKFQTTIGTTAADPVLSKAYQIWSQNKTTRWLLEANLFTSRTFAEIAEVCQIKKRVVRAYHELFFEVRPHLNASDWILQRAIGSSPWNHFAGPQPAGIWKYCGFIGDAPLLDLVVAVTLDRPLPGAIQATFVTNPVLEDECFRLKVKLFFATCTAKTDKALATAARRYYRLAGLKRRVGLGSELESADYLPYLKVLTMQEKARPTPYQEPDQAPETKSAPSTHAKTTESPPKKDSHDQKKTQNQSKKRSRKSRKERSTE
jgi:hypothetical protein